MPFREPKSVYGFRHLKIRTHRHDFAQNKTKMVVTHYIAELRGIYKIDLCTQKRGPFEHALSFASTVGDSEALRSATVSRQLRQSP